MKRDSRRSLVRVLFLVLVMAAFSFCEPSAASVTLSNTPDAPPSIPRIDGGVRAIARGATHVYVGGSFTTVSNGAYARAGLAAFHAETGALDVNWDPGLGNGINSVDVYALVVDNGKVYVGGRFLTAGGVARNNLAAFSEATGSSPATLDPFWNPNADNVVFAITASANHIYAGGAFETVNGSVARNVVAAFNKADHPSPGTVDPFWNPNLDYVTGWFDWPVVVVLAVHDNFIYVGGEFNRVRGPSGQIVRNHLAAVELANNSNTGRADASWDPGIDSFGTVEALAIANGRLYVGGTSFQTVLNGAYTRHRLAAFNLAGGGSSAQVDPWNPMMSGSVYALAVNGGRVFAGGNFESVLNGSVLRRNLAAFNEADGVSSATVDPWNPIAAAYWNYYVMAMASALDHGVYLGGNFIYIGGRYRYYLAGYATEWSPAPYIRLVYPADEALLFGPDTAIDVTFSQNVYDVDASDLVLSGPAAVGAVVGAPSLMHQYPSGISTSDREMWRFPITGLSEGALSVTLAPNPGDIVNNYGRSLAQTNNSWDYTVVYAAASMPFQDTFETGAFNDWWDRRGTTRYFRNRILDTQNPCEALQHLVLDNSLTGTYTRNEVTLTIDLAGQSDVSLSFIAKVPDSWSPPAPPVPFYNGHDFDGVAVSADGLYWYEVQSLRIGDGIDDNCQEFVVDLDAAIAAHGLSYNENFKIRFNHHDFWPYGVNGGMAIDNVRLSSAIPAPEVVNVTSNKPDGAYPLGEIIDIQVVFSHLVTVTGAPTLTLETGSVNRDATYLDGAGSDTLVFRYIVQAGDSASDLDYADSNSLQLNGGTIQSVAHGEDALLALPAPGALGSLSYNKNIAIDTTAPSLGSVGVTGYLTATVTFNQAMGAGVTTPGNYMLTGTAQGTLAVHPSTVTSLGAYQYQLAWADGEMHIGGDFTITATNMADAIGNPIGMNNSATHVGGGMGKAPQVLSVAVTGPLAVSVTYDEPVSADALLAASYTASGSALGTLTAQPDHVVAGPGNTCLLSWDTGEMFHGGDMTIVVSNAVTDLAGNPIDGMADSATHVGGGIGVPPELLDVEVLDSSYILLTFSESLLASSLFMDNFAVSGSGRGTLTLRPQQVIDEGGGSVRLRWTNGEMKGGGDITIAVEGVRDLAGNPVPDNTSATHSGGAIGVPPELQYIEVESPRTIMIQYNEIMGSGMTNPVNYILSGTGALTTHPDNVLAQGFEMYLLEWYDGEMFIGGDITITAVNAEDLAGNPVNHGITAFGVGMGAPPLAAISLNDGATVTNTLEVVVRFTQADGTGSAVTDMRFSNDALVWSEWQAFAESATWTLTDGDAWKQVYAQIRDAAGNVSETPASDTIILDMTPLTVVADSDLNVVKAVGESHEFAVTIIEGLFGDPVFEWTHTPAEKSAALPRVKDAGEAVLVLENIQLEDAGLYACQVTDDTESAEPVVFSLDVYEFVAALHTLTLALLAILLCVAFVRTVQAALRT